MKSVLRTEKQMIGPPRPIPDEPVIGREIAIGVGKKQKKKTYIVLKKKEVGYT